ncbi:MAG: transmembrane sensory transduction histidine kinase for metal resistance [Thermomicrobium sp.]|nr:transmembrane sensory transduction histidine kinase for metal resistance [Thermomicrobium sp.]
MDFDLMDMLVVALVGLLGIASLAAWSSAVLWRRQRALERVVAGLVARLEGPAAGDRSAASPGADGETSDPSVAISELVDLLKRVDRQSLREVLNPPLDLPRAPALDVDGRGQAPRFGFPAASHRSGWEA